jgi:hypothetical protein
MTRLVVLVLAAMLLAGCATARAATNGGGGVVGSGCGQPGEFEYVGETSLAALGLGGTADGQFQGPDVDRVGSVWVSIAGKVPDGMLVGDRMICIEYDDGSIMASTIDASWQPPAVLEAPSEETGGGVPTPILLVGGGAIVIIGFSVVAFRREAAGST